MTTTQQALDYIKNAGGTVKKDKFIEDFEPMGQRLLDELWMLDEVVVGIHEGKSVILLSDLD